MASNSLFLIYIFTLCLEKWLRNFLLAILLVDLNFLRKLHRLSLEQPRLSETFLPFRWPNHFKALRFPQASRSHPFHLHRYHLAWELLLLRLDRLHRQLPLRASRFLSPLPLPQFSPQPRLPLRLWHKRSQHPSQPPLPGLNTRCPACLLLTPRAPASPAHTRSLSFSRSLRPPRIR